MSHYNIRHWLATGTCIGISALGLMVAPLAQAGTNSLDKSFGSNGKVLTPAAIFSGNPDVAIQADGKIVVLIGEQLTRYHLDGSLDSTLATSGSPYPYGSQLAIQLDGKILTTGAALSRYNSDGSLDATFGIAGQASDSSISDLALQSDGKIIGIKNIYAGSWNGQPYCTNQLERYNTNGTLDSSFGINGKVNYGETSSCSGKHLAVQSDNKILVGSGGNGVTVTRFNADGNLDSSFGSNGSTYVSYTPPITYDNYQCLFYNGGLGLANVLAQPDGKIVVVGNSGQCDQKNISHNAFSRARFNADGSLDSSFGSGGKAVTPNTNATGRALYDAALQADGKIVAVGYIVDPNVPHSYGYTDDFVITRYKTNGDVDGSLSVTTKIGLGSSAYGVAIQTDGKVVSAGFATADDSTYNSALVRYLP